MVHSTPAVYRSGQRVKIAAGERQPPIAPSTFCRLWWIFRWRISEQNWRFRCMMMYVTYNTQQYSIFSNIHSHIRSYSILDGRIPNIYGSYGLGHWQSSDPSVKNRRQFPIGSIGLPSGKVEKKRLESPLLAPMTSTAKSLDIPVQHHCICVFVIENSVAICECCLGSSESRCP